MRYQKFTVTAKLNKQTQDQVHNRSEN